MTRVRTVSVFILFLVAAGCGSDDDAGGSGVSAGDTAASCPTEGAEFSDAKIFIEHNATDEDTGCTRCSLQTAGGSCASPIPMGNGSWSSSRRGSSATWAWPICSGSPREPENSEYSIDDLKADFPEGDYRVSGIDVEGNQLVGTAEFTHTIPAPATITAPSLADEAEAAAETAHAPEGFEVRWEPVTQTIDGEPLELTGYEVIITDEAFEDANGFSKPVYDVHLRPEATSLTVPPEFFTPGTVYELEVLALESSGNQTISLGFFSTT